jgi:hypothetical protein
MRGVKGTGINRYVSTPEIEKIRKTIIKYFKKRRNRRKIK